MLLTTNCSQKGRRGQARIEESLIVCSLLILRLCDPESIRICLFDGVHVCITATAISIGTHPHLTAASHYLATDELTEELYEVISSDTNQTHWPYPHLRSAE